MLFSQTDNSMGGTGEGLFSELRCKTSSSRVELV